jgi:hypothetical protein
MVPPLLLWRARRPTTIATFRFERHESSFITGRRGRELEAEVTAKGALDEMASPLARIAPRVAALGSAARRRDARERRGAVAGARARALPAACWITRSPALRRRRATGGAVARAGRDHVAAASATPPPSSVARRHRVDEEADALAAATDGDDDGAGAGVGGVMSMSILAAVAYNALTGLTAMAYEGYDGIGVPDDEATPLQNAFGFAFTIFCAWYFVRVVKKRGNRAKEFRVANALPVRVRAGRPSVRQLTLNLPP